MNSTTLRLKYDQFIDTGNDTCECVIDLLPAYAINYTELSIGGISHCEGSNYRLDIENSKLIILYDYSSFIKCAKDGSILFVINYFGIRDYSLLFPKIKEKDIAKRLGNFYEEAEKCFSNNAWLGYSLMCGAIFEGMLFSKNSSKESFQKLIDDAYNSGDIDRETANIMNFTREARNLIHADNYEKEYITRVKAMDIRTTMDKLIKGFKY